MSQAQILDYAKMCLILVLRLSLIPIAVATVIGNMVSACFYILYVKRRAAVISLELRRAFVMPREILPILALGLPNAASTVLSGFASTFSNNLLSQHGTDAIAAAAAAGRAQSPPPGYSSPFA